MDSPFDSKTKETSTVPKQRKRLNLKPRDEARAAQLESNLSQAQSSSLFGDAKPRERIIADRDGKTEEEVLREEVKKDKLHLRLTPEQNQERMLSEAAVKEIEEQIDAEADEGRKKILQVELNARREKLEGLTERFAQEVLSEGGKHVGQRERYQPTRNSIEGVGMGGEYPHHGNYAQQGQYAQYNAARGRGGGGRGRGRGYNNGYGIVAGGVGVGNGIPPPQMHPHYIQLPHVHPQRHTQYQPTAYGTYGVPMQTPGMTVHHLPQQHHYLPQQHQTPQNHQMFYQGPPAGVGMGGEIEFDAPEFAGARY